MARPRGASRWLLFTFSHHGKSITSLVFFSNSIEDIHQQTQQHDATMMKSFSLSSTSRLVVFAFLSSIRNVADAVDIRFHSVTCDESLPIIPEFTKHCSPCVLGQSHEFSGISKYFKTPEGDKDGLGL